MVYFCYSSSLNLRVAYIFFVLDSHLATLWESNCPFGFLQVMFPLEFSYFMFVFLSLWCLWWEVWDNCIDSWSLPSLLFSYIFLIMITFFEDTPHDNILNQIPFLYTKSNALRKSMKTQKNFLPVFICLCWGFTAQSTQWGHVERGQFT